jgi:hypothetical protein
METGLQVCLKLDKVPVVVAAEIVVVAAEIVVVAAEIVVVAAEIVVVPQLGKL